MIAPGTLCTLRNPMAELVAFYQHLGGEVTFIPNNKDVFLIIVVPIRQPGSSEHFAWGLLGNGHLGFVNCKWLIEVREDM